MLTNRTAVVYGAGGVIGGAVARAFARDGARVSLTGRTRAKVRAVANDIPATGTGFPTACAAIQTIARPWSSSIADHGSTRPSVVSRRK